jgi:hypothetical protein
MANCRLAYLTSNTDMHGKINVATLISLTFVNLVTTNQKYANNQPSLFILMWALM